jgi:AcrR family transcriptional regulator
MSDRGYAGTSISKIVAESGLPASSTYWHFGSKEKLLAAVIDQAATEFFRSIPQLDEFDGSPRERFRARLKQRTKTTSFLRLLFIIALERGDAKGEIMATIRRVRNEVKDSYRRDFAEIYGTPGDPEALQFVDDVAAFSLAALDGLFLAGQIEPGKVDRGRTLTMIADAFLALSDAFVASRNGRPVPATAKLRVRR